MRNFLEFLELMAAVLLIPFTLFVVCPFLLSWLVGYAGGAR